MCLFCIFTSGFIEAFEIAEIENSVPQEIASSQTWWVLFIWLIVNFVTWLTGVLGTCFIESGPLGLAEVLGQTTDRHDPGDESYRCLAEALIVIYRY